MVESFQGLYLDKDATLTLTGDLKEMYVDDANVQLLHVASESRIDPMDTVTHAAGGLMNISNGQLGQPNVNVDKAL